VGTNGDVTKIFFQRCCCAMLGVAFCGIVIYSARLARADWLRHHPTPSGVEEAIQLDPMNAYGYTLRAEVLERAGRDSLPAWLEASRNEPRNAETLIHIALLEERRGHLPAAERCLLQAAQDSQTWLPRWSLTNYYFRHSNRAEGFRWARLAAERAIGNLRALFQTLEEAGATPEFVIGSVLPVNRNVRVQYLSHCLERRQTDGIEPAAKGLAELIPGRPAGWPGLDVDPLASLVHRTYGVLPEERQVLLAAIDALLARDRPQPAVSLWNSLCDRDIVRNSRWSPGHPVVNGEFRAISLEGALDWRMAKSDGVTAAIWPDLKAAIIGLTGRQPETVALLTQTLYLPANRIYRFQAESMTKLMDPIGVTWELRDAHTGDLITSALPVVSSADWTGQSAEIAGSANDRIVQLTLWYRRASGTVRAEGEIRLRAVTIENRS